MAKKHFPHCPACGGLLSSWSVRVYVHATPVSGSAARAHAMRPGNPVVRTLKKPVLRLYRWAVDKKAPPPEFKAARIGNRGGKLREGGSLPYVLNTAYNAFTGRADDLLVRNPPNRVMRRILGIFPIEICHECYEPHRDHPRQLAEAAAAEG